MIAEIRLAVPRKVNNRPNYRRAAQYAHNVRRCIYHGVILGSRRRRGENWLASSARCLTRTISTLHRWQRDHAMAWQTLKMTTVAVDLLLFENWNEAIDHHVRTEVRGFIEAMPEEGLPAALGRGPRYRPRRATANGNTTQAPAGLRHGHRERVPLGTFGETISDQRARFCVKRGVCTQTATRVRAREGVGRALGSDSAKLSAPSSSASKWTATE